MSYVLFISENVLKDSGPINGNVDMEHLLPHVKNAQRIRIHPHLGTSLYEKLKADITAGTLVGNYKTLVEDYIQSSLVQWSTYQALPYLRFRIMNNGVVSKNADNSTAIGSSEFNSLREEIRNTAEYFDQRLISHLCNNPTLYPEYNTNTGEQLDPSHTAFYSGLNLESERDGYTTLDNYLHIH